MDCLKCGKETEEKNVFCADCLAVMARYPVKPGTPVQLPRRATPAPEKKSSGSRKRTIAQRYRQLLTISYWLWGSALTLLVLVCLLAYQLFH